MMPFLRRYEVYVWLAAMAVTVGALALYASTLIQPIGVTRLATESTKVTKLETVTVTPPSVSVYEPAAKKKLGLPKHVQGDTKQHVIAATTVKPSTRPQTTTTVLDESTGLSATYTSTDPSAWLGANPSGSVSLSYGLRSGDMVARLAVTQDIFQIKALSFGGVGHLDSDGQYFVGAGVNYRW
jgi:hypothetical protein